MKITNILLASLLAMPVAQLVQAGDRSQECVNVVQQYRGPYDFRVWNYCHSVIVFEMCFNGRRCEMLFVQPGDEQPVVGGGNQPGARITYDSCFKTSWETGRCRGRADGR